MRDNSNNNKSSINHIFYSWFVKPVGNLHFVDNSPLVTVLKIYLINTLFCS